MYIVKDPQIILNQALANLAANSSIGNLGPGSKARALVEAVSTVVGNISMETAAGIISTLLPNATGSALDLIGESFGVIRLEAVPARVESTDNNFKYYVRGGTFGSINNGNPITIPRGTQLQADSNTTTTYFIQRETITLPSNESVYYFAADQGGSVTRAGLPPYLVTRHNFTGYAQSAFSSLLVANEKGIAARPLESDDSMRFRIRRKITEVAGGNQIAVRLAALQIPGVSDVKIMPNRAGLGTVDVVVFGVDPVVSEGLIASVQNSVDRVVAAGSRAIAVPPRLVGVSLSASIHLKPNLPSGERNQIVQSIKQNIAAYVTSLTSGQTLVVNELVNTILNSSDKVIDLGAPGKPFDSIYIWRSNRPFGNRYSRNLEINYLIKEDEEMIIEPFIANPINIVEAL